MSGAEASKQNSVLGASECSMQKSHRCFGYIKQKSEAYVHTMSSCHIAANSTATLPAGPACALPSLQADWHWYVSSHVLTFGCAY